MLSGAVIAALYTAVSLAIFPAAPLTRGRV